MEGLIYKILDYKENSCLVYLYTLEGLEEVLVYQAKKYNSLNMPFCEVLNYVSYNRTGKSLKKLLDYEIINRFTNIKNSYIKLKYASIILEILRQIDDVRYPKILGFTIKTLKEMEIKDDVISICFIYLVKMLKIFGILPNLNDDILDISYTNNIDKLELSNLIKQAYYDRDFTTKASKGAFCNVINYYNKLDAINTYYIYKMLED